MPELFLELKTGLIRGFVCLASTHYDSCRSCITAILNRHYSAARQCPTVGAIEKES